MGGYLIMFMAMLLSVWALVLPSRQDAAMSSVSTARPTLQALAANMVEFHRAMLEFVQRPQNRTPTNKYWWAYAQGYLQEVSCTATGSTYLANSTGGSCTAPTTDYQPPVFFTAATDWEAYFQCDTVGFTGCRVAGKQDILVTDVWANSPRYSGGYTSAQILGAIKAYPLFNENWLVGQCQNGGATGYQLPDRDGNLHPIPWCSFVGVVTIATIVP